MSDGWNIIGALIGGGFGSALVTFLLDRWKERLAATRAWKQAAVSELFGPLVMQFDRTKRAFARYNNTNQFLEAEVMRKSNTAIRDLLLAKGQYLPPELLDHAGKLVEHYDVWLEVYERVRKPDAPDTKTKFVFAGPEGFLFPGEAENALREHCDRLKRELFDAKA
jgi:hypothetical protein